MNFTIIWIFINFHAIDNRSCLACISQCGQRFVKMQTCRRNCSQHNCFWVATQTFLRRKKHEEWDKYDSIFDWLKNPPTAIKCSLTFSSHVNTDSRYGANVFFFGSASALITRPNVSKLRFMLTRSFSRSPPAHVWLTRSLPAKSTKLMWLRFVISFDDSESISDSVKIMLNIECDRELLSFIPVASKFNWQSSHKFEMVDDVWLFTTSPDFVGFVRPNTFFKFHVDVSFYWNSLM